MSKFYVLEPVDGYFGTKWAYGEEVDPVFLGDVERCPVCKSAISLKRWLPPHRIRLSSAKPGKWGDFLWIGGTSLAVSRHFREIYEQESLQGISAFSNPIEVVRYGTKKTGDFAISPPEYYMIYVPWGGANQDDVASSVVHEIPEAITCTYCRTGVSKRSQPRIVLDLNSWDGSDIFRPRGAPASYMVSEKFRKVCKESKLTNVWLIPGEEYGWDAQRPGLWYINKTKGERS